ncbi:MAG: oxidoreductase [Flavobacteriales bacterium CG_4_9_14_3_um_filter_40_17]|nr:MAG: oxidoreductase [Flavobacteriales bacterium CG_4_9_14_3_um_filter_40_17]
MKKNILLIGGSYGIGLEIIRLLNGNENLFIASRTYQNLQNFSVKHITFDASKDVFEISQIPDVLDGFVYCPGSINLRPFRGIKPEVFEEDLKINFLDMIKILQLVLPNLKKSPQASILLFSSVAAQLGMPFHTSVAAAKGAIESFVKAFAAEHAPQIRANVIAPSLTDTPLANKFLSNDEKKEKAGMRHPLKRVGLAEDIAQMAVFLLSDNTSWVTGQIFRVDGGMSTLNVS